MDLGGPFGGPMPPPYLGPFPPGQLEAPGSVWATPLSPSHVHVSWLDTRAEAGFRIYVGDPSSTTRTLVAEVLANVTSRDIQGLSVDTRYCYWVSGFNYAGESPLGGPACARTPGFGSAVPVAPTNLEVARTDSRSGVAALRLTWIDRSSNETSFQIWRGDQLIAEVGANVTTYTDSTWTPSITNCYRVVAASSTGEATSPEVCAAGGLGNPPAAPTNLSILTSGVVGDLLLEWTDRSNNESGFRVIRNNVVVATLEPSVTSYRDPSPSPVLGCYVVEAFNSSGEARSNQACAP
jgi:titin